MAVTRPIAEWRNVDAETFRRDIVPAGQPAVLRGLVDHWPSVAAGQASPQALAAMLKACDNGKPGRALVGPPSIKGRFFYRDDMTGFNFERHAATVSAVVDQLLAAASDPSPHAIALQSLLVADHLPGLIADDAMPLLDKASAPRAWIGNAISVSTHFDFNHNIACVVGGRRRFTLFPPDQIANLYVGPLDFTPAGTPVSMAPLDGADDPRYPRLAQALETACTAELDPGDAIYIPYFWWHHVESLSAFNVLVNYWWKEGEINRGAPFDVLLHAILVIRDLPAQERETLRTLFDHYVFQTGGDPAAHLAPEHRGVLGPIKDGQVAAMKAFLVGAINAIP